MIKRTRDRILATTMSLSLSGLVAGSGLGCASTRAVADQADDRWITSRVAMRLAGDPDIRKLDIDVDTLGDEVTLRGNVPDQADKAEAEGIARDTRGVRGVENLLVVAVDDDIGDGHWDGRTTRRIERSLRRDPEVKSRNVDTDTDDGVVTLSGAVESPQAAQAAVNIAGRAEGVSEVVDELIYAYPDTRLSLK